MLAPGKERGEITFVCNLKAGAKKVFLAGDFNGWSPRARRMMKAKDGAFRAKMRLQPGKHEYKFVVDGVWLHDPNAHEQVTNPHGTINSVACID